MSKFNRSLAVVIGINNYQNGIDPLQTAVPDAVAIAEILQKNYKYQLIHSDFDSGVIIDRYATKERLKSLLTDILPNEIKPTKGDRLIFYFAGHGIARNSDGGPEGYLVPQDADLKDRDSLLKMRDVHDWLSQLECRHVLIVLDCCLAGTFRWSSYRKLIPVSGEITKAHYDRFINFPAWQVITSASHNQEALDFLNNRDIQTDKKHSPFAEGLIKALQQEKGDLNNDGVIIATELYLYLRDYVELNSKDRQTPGFFPLKKHDRGEYLFELANTPLNLKPTPELNKENNPYRGLEPFEARHSKLFFGRDEAIDNLLTKVCQANNRLTVVSGISGSGKSSLVKAGLIPYLQQEQGQKWLVLEPIRPETNPYAALARVLAQLNDGSTTKNTTLLGKQLQNHSQKFISAIQAWSHQHRDRRLLLVIDQFEELITMSAKAKLVYSKSKPSLWQKLQQKLSPKNDKLQQDKSLTESEPWQEFVALLKKILNECPQLSLVITLRSDFEPRFEETAFGSVWTKARFLVRPMRSQELREAVEKPAAEKALYFEPPELVDRLVDEVSQMPGALPLLSFTLSEMYIKLYEAWRDLGEENRALSVTQDFDRQGGVAGVLTRRANHVYDSLGDRATQQMMRKVMLRMVELEGGEALRQRVLTSELVYPEAAENQRKDEVLKRLLAARLIVTGTDTEANQQYYEPAHDFLVRGWDKLQKWIDEEQKKGNLALQSLLIPAAKAWQKESKDLWDNNSRLDRLQEIQEQDSVENNWLNKIESEFVAKSIKKRKSRQRQALSIFTGVTLALSSLTGWALFSLRNSLIEEIHASVQSSEASFNSRQRFDAFLSAIQAVKTRNHKMLGFFPPSGNRNLDNKLKKVIYQAQMNNLLRNELEGHENAIDSIEFSPDGQYIVTASADGTAKIWTKQGESFATLEGHEKAVNTAKFSPDGQYIVTASADDTAKLWTKQGELLATIEGHAKMVNNAVFSPDGQFIVTASLDRTAKVWNTAQLIQGDKKLVTTLKWHQYSIDRVEFSPDSKLIMTVSDLNIWDREASNYSGTAKVWSRQGELITTFPGYAEFSPDGQFILSISPDNTAQIWKTAKIDEGDRALVHTFEYMNIKSAKFSPNSEQIITISNNENNPNTDFIQVWSLAKLWQGETYSDSLFEAKNLSKYLRFSSDGEHLITISKPDNNLVSNYNNTLKVWSIAKGIPTATYRNNEEFLQTAKFIPESKYIITNSGDGKAKIWAREGSIANTLEDRQERNDSAENDNTKVSNDGRFVLTISPDGTANVRQQNGEPISIFKESNYTIGSAEFSPDAELIITTPPFTDHPSDSQNYDAKIWQKDGTLITTLEGHTDPVIKATFSPDGNYIATAAYNGVVKLWDKTQVLQGQQESTITFNAHPAPVSDLEFSPDGKLLLTASSWEQLAKIWETEKVLQKERSLFATLTGHSDALKTVKFSKDGNFVITASCDKTVRIWTKQGELIAILDGHHEYPTNVEVSENGDYITTTADDGTVRMWNLDLYYMLGQACQEIADYLQNNPNVNESDRNLCQS